MSADTPRTASATGLATIDSASGRVLAVWFPAPVLGDDAPDAIAGAAEREDAVRGVRIEPCEGRIDLDAPPADTADAYLRLHLLSHRLVQPARRQPRRHLRRPAQRRLDEPGPGRSGGAARRPPARPRGRPRTCT